MTHAFVTVAVPFEDAKADAAEARLRELGNPASATVRDALRDRGIHFMSMNVVRGDQNHGAFLILEASADGTADGALETIAAQLKDQIVDVLRAAAQQVRAEDPTPSCTVIRMRSAWGCLLRRGLCFPARPA